MKPRVPLPAPVKGYVAREYLGSGAWKVAFRATSNEINDVALLAIKDRSRSAEIAKDVKRAIELCRDHEYSAYLAEFISVVKNSEGDLFIIEELLLKPLYFDAPLADVIKWTNYARDLARGLTCIHENRQEQQAENRLVHRDLKLDNCGVSKTGQAKIFDLGSLTTEGGKVECTILSRAPELFGDQTTFTTAADVWALGATLFALRTGRYPFVEPTEMQLRRDVNDRLAAGEITASDATKAKEDIDRNIGQRARRANAKVILFGQIDQLFSPQVAGPLKEMLSFDPSERQEIRHYAETWTEISAYMSGVGPPPDCTGKWNQIRRMLTSVLHGELPLTVKQFGRLATEWSQEKDAIVTKQEMTAMEIEALEGLLTQTKKAVERPAKVSII